MPPGEQADEDAIDHILLANNDFSDFLAYPIDLSSGDLKSRIQLHALYDSAARRNPRLCQMGSPVIHSRLYRTYVWLSGRVTAFRF